MGSANTPEVKSTKTDEGSKSELKKIIVEDSGWSFGKSIITALAAVTVAIISSKLTNTVSSLILVVILSFCSALATEIYRVIVGLAGLAAKKAVAPLGTSASPKATEDSDIEDALDRPAEDKSSEPSEHPRTHQMAAVTEAFRIPAEKGEETGFWASIIRHGKANPALKFIGLFLVVSLIAIGASSYVASRVEKTENTYTTVQRPTELSAEEGKKLVDEAVKRADQKASQGDQKDKAAVDNSQKEMADLLAAMKTENESLAARLSALEKASATPNADGYPKTSGDADHAELLRLKTENEKLLERIAALEKKVAETPAT